ncbi:hypothetical protein [Rhizobium mongolense]|uniref:Uncharacterized protein n=1 Tax=Rhizobium mongolense TaxID=57676 RepID=A0A7W6WIN9_9HYPH|nr:hypothetical protein [Rhizobium mongolense]MBB4279531.1 hypothetical protein [Rhizobium mongolense]
MAASKFRPPPQRLLHAEPTELARRGLDAIGDVSDDDDAAFRKIDAQSTDSEVLDIPSGWIRSQIPSIPAPSTTVMRLAGDRRWSLRSVASATVKPPFSAAHIRFPQ